MTPSHLERKNKGRNIQMTCLTWLHGVQLTRAIIENMSKASGAQVFFSMWMSQPSIEIIQEIATLQIVDVRGDSP